MNLKSYFPFYVHRFSTSKVTKALQDLVNTSILATSVAPDTGRGWRHWSSCEVSNEILVTGIIADNNIPLYLCSF